jgi:hypothetical protein
MPSSKRWSPTLAKKNLTLCRETKRIETERLHRTIPPAECDWYL